MPHCREMRGCEGGHLGTEQHDDVEAELEEEGLHDLLLHSEMKTCGGQTLEAGDVWQVWTVVGRPP